MNYGITVEPDAFFGLLARLAALGFPPELVELEAEKVPAFDPGKTEHRSRVAFSVWDRDGRSVRVGSISQTRSVETVRVNGWPALRFPSFASVTCSVEWDDREPVDPYARRDPDRLDVLAILGEVEKTLRPVP